MQIHITGHSMEVTPAIRTYTEGKFTKLEHHYDQINKINVIFDIEKLSQIAEATIFVTGAELYAKSESENLYAAIDALIDKLDRQLLKHKEKMRSH
ncbi:ribosome hibernation-promoting factor, HPF/YfiA family [Legionella rowbothamii]|uniref:ribosome hibernation-promoting factor, HPF/YfiA family n=1 Tax=Legionella rowbothamii TaxID=96229 RepID=UPI0010560F2D|nr:ribosome-associated translation inhibitor RaiA [Legionella rowbothamii]